MSRSFSEAEIKLLSHSIYRFALAQLHHHEKAEDVCSETLLRLWRDKENLSQVNNVNHWALGIARNIMLNMYRSKHNDTNELDEGMDMKLADVKGTEESAISAALVSETREQLAKLDEFTREVIILKTWEELKFEEIAEVTREKLSTVKLRYYRGLQRLKALIEEKEGKKTRVLAWPLVIGAIGKVGEGSTYHPSPALQAKLLNSLTQKNMWTKISTWLAAHKLLAILSIATGIVGITTIVALLLISQGTQNNRMPTPTQPVEPPVVTTPAPEPEPTPTPEPVDPTADWVYYEVPELNLKFRHPQNWVFSKQVYSDGTMVIHAEDPSFTKAKSEGKAVWSEQNWILEVGTYQDRMSQDFFKYMTIEDPHFIFNPVEMPAIKVLNGDYTFHRYYTAEGFSTEIPNCNDSGAMYMYFTDMPGIASITINNNISTQCNLTTGVEDKVQTLTDDMKIARMIAETIAHMN